MLRPTVLVLALAAASALAPALAQSTAPAWTARLDTPTSGPLGAHTHAAPDGDGSLYALGFASAVPQGLDVRLERFGSGGTRSWSVTLPGAVDRDDVPLALEVSAAGPCAAYVTPSGTGPGDLARTSVTCATRDGAVRWTAVVGGVAAGFDQFGLLGTLALAAYDDGGALVSAVSATGAPQLVLVRLGPSGTQAWRKAFNLGASLYARTAVAVEPLPDGGAMVAAAGAGLLRIGPDGSVVWKAQPDGDRVSYANGLVALAVGPDGDVVVTGHALTPGMYPQPVTARYTTGGTLRWTADTPQNLLPSQIVAFAPSGETLHAYGFSVEVVDVAGRVAWSGRYNLGYGAGANLAAVLPLPDGGVVLVGSATAAQSAESGRAVRVVAFNAGGVVRWSARHAASSGPAVAFAAALLQDGAIGAAGATSSGGGTVPELVVFGSDGAEVAATTSEAAPRPRSAVQGIGAVTGGVLVFGPRPEASGAPRLHVTKVAASGTEAWSTVVPDLSDRWYHPFVSAPDGGGVVAGRNEAQYSRNVRVVRIGPGGGIEWNVVYDGSGSGEEDPAGVVALEDGGAVVAITESDGQGREAIVVAYGPDGSVLWSDRFSTAASRYGFAVAVAPLGKSALLEGTVVIADVGWEAVVRAYAPDGRLLWEHVGDGRPSSIAGTPGGGACYTGTVTRCLGPTGAVLWEGAARGSLVAVGSDGTVTAVTVASELTSDGSRPPAPLRLARYGAGGTPLWDVQLGPDLGHGLGYYRLTGLSAVGDGYVVLAASSYANGYYDAGAFVVGPDGTERWRHAVPAAEPDRDAQRGPRLALGVDGALYAATTQGGTVSYVQHPSVLYRAATYSVAEVTRFDRSALPVSAEGQPVVAGGGLRTWPNPSSGPVTVALALPSAGPVRVAVYDALGRQVALLHDGPLGAGAHEYTLGVSALPAGLYVVRAVAAGGSFVQRIAVVR